MCSGDKAWLQNYAANERILISDEVDCSARTAAWREQAAILHHITKDTSASMQRTALALHVKKLSHKDQVEFLQQRAKGVDALLGAYIAPSYELTVRDELEEFINEARFESSCRGSYESCQYTEMTAEKLMMLKGEAGKSEGTASCSKSRSVITPLQSIEATRTAIPTAAKNTVSACLKRPCSPPQPPVATKVAPITAKQNTLSAYLKRPPSPSQTPAINMVGRTAADIHLAGDNLLEQQARGANNGNALVFRTAREELMIQNMKKQNVPWGCSSNFSEQTPLFNYASTKKSLGARRKVNSNFVLPVRSEDRPRASTSISSATTSTFYRGSPNASPTCTPPDAAEPPPVDERLINIDPKMIELITNEIMHKNQPVDWNDIAGLDYAKSVIKEAVVYPLLRPDIFTGLRRPPRGILLFGPPGTGKTLIGKCIASQSNSTFFSISASSLTSKWVGDGEKMVRALFAVAAVHQPSVVFIDEIDSLLSQRSENEHESSRRLKTEFLVQLDGAATSNDDRILIVGATNRPQELDEAARRRLVRRLYIPLPELEARIQILKNLLQTVLNNLTPDEIREIGELTVGYSGADMESLCREAAMEPIRSIPTDEITFFKVENVRPVNKQDFSVALLNVRPSVSQSDLKQYSEWNRIYGAGK